MAIFITVLLVEESISADNTIFLNSYSDSAMMSIPALDICPRAITGVQGLLLQ